MSSFLHGLNTGAAGAVRGVALADEMMNRREEGDRADRRMAIAEAGEQRASRMGAIQEEASQLSLDQAKQKDAWQKEDQAEFASFHNEKDDKGNPIPWTPERELQWGERVFSRAHSRGQVSPEQYKHMVDLREQFDTKKMKGAWAAVLAGDDKGAAPLREKFDAKELRVSRNKENGMWEITGTKNDDTPISMPLGMASPIVGEKAGKEINDWLKDSTDADLKKAQIGAYGAIRSNAQSEARAKQVETELNNLYRTNERSVLREAEILTNKLADPNLGPKEKEAGAQQLAELRKRHDVLTDEKSSVSSIISAAGDKNIKVPAAQAQKILREVMNGQNIKFPKDGGDPVYVTAGGKEIPLPPQVVPRDLYPKSAGAGSTAPPPAAPDASPRPSAFPPQAAPAPQPAARPVPAYEQFIKAKRGGYYIDAPQRSSARALAGKAFPSKEAAMQALSQLEAFKE